jgi:glycosyltransferase involved in cell wall biosynthesis
LIRVLHVVPVLASRFGGPAINVVECAFASLTHGVQASVVSTNLAGPPSRQPSFVSAEGELPLGTQQIDVSHRVGSAFDLVRSGHNGFVVPHDDLDALTGALHRLVVSDDLRARLGEASRQMIAPLTYEVAAAGLVNAVRTAVGEARWTLAEASARESVAA